MSSCSADVPTPTCAHRSVHQAEQRGVLRDRRPPPAARSQPACSRRTHCLRAQRSRVPAERTGDGVPRSTKRAPPAGWGCCATGARPAPRAARRNRGTTRRSPWLRRTACPSTPGRSTARRAPRVGPLAYAGRMQGGQLAQQGSQCGHAATAAARTCGAMSGGTQLSVACAAQTRPRRQVGRPAARLHVLAKLGSRSRWKNNAGGGAWAKVHALFHEKVHITPLEIYPKGGSRGRPAPRLL